VYLLDINPEAKERNNGYIMDGKSASFQVTFADGA
jgi:hypothetical protein